MALDLVVRYPGQVVAGDPAYPFGRARNVITEGDGDGTPYEQDIVNDTLGFLQALLVEANINPSLAADTALVSQYKMALDRIRRWAAGWGAVGDDATDDTGALQAALNAVAGLGSGLQELHLTPGRVYRHTGLSVPANVSIFFHGATLKITSAVSAHLTYAGAFTGKQFLLLDRPVFAASVAAAGTVISVTASLTRLIVRNAEATQSNLQGKFLECGALTSCVIKIDTVEWQPAVSKQFVQMRDGQLTIDHVRGVFPAAFSGAAIEINGSCQARIDDTFANFSSHTTGAAQFVKLTNAGASLLVGKLNVVGTPSSDAVVIDWTAAALVVETGLRSDGITRYSGTTLLKEGSSLSLQPHAILDIVHDSTFALPSGVRAVSLRTDINAQPVNVEMPPMYFEGQPFTLAWYNRGSSDPLALVEMNAVGTDIVAGDPDDLNAGYIRTGEFRVMRNFILDRWDWLQIGAWSEFIFHGHEIGS